jgi:hypothetical protein
MKKKFVFGLFLKLLGYWLSWLSANTLKEIFKRNFKKTSRYQEAPVKMCLSSIYYSNFGCCDA